MRRILTVITSVLLTFAFAYGQGGFEPSLMEAFKDDPTRSATNHRPYEPGDMHDTQPPAGFKAFYISHYGRHGSRHSWGGSYYDLIIGSLEKADSLGILTPEGRAVLEQTIRVNRAWDGMDGRLSQRGVREHDGIARRMVKRFPSVFKGKPQVRAVSSTVQRCIISMNAFTTAVSSERPRTRWYLDTGERVMDYVGETGHSAKACRKLTNAMMDNIFDAPCDSTLLLGRLFTDPEAGRALIPSLRRFHKALFRTAGISGCWDIEDHIFPVLQPEYIYRFYSYDCHYIVSRYGNCTESGTARFDSLSLLVSDIVNKADEAIAGGEYCADLRFGHDYPLISLVSFLGVEGPGSKLDFDQIDSRWLGWKELCMASNLQMVFYRNRAGKVLVKFLYQEQERMLRNLESVTGPYYDWETVKANIRGYKR
ncbi:MAG: hypothetical protein J6O51_05495 [Bacteroidales bacterium]|nr:hypothetical protein [Bacteroidales bacterium]